MIILLHTSKTMRQLSHLKGPFRKPQLLNKTRELDGVLKKLSISELSKIMKISSALAQKTHQMIEAWTNDPQVQSPALDSFIGDIYSGLRAEGFSEDDRNYADQHLFILSGLYGVLRPLDGIFPYRLEMGYKVSSSTFKNLYEFWGKSIAECLPKNEFIINLASEEFSKPVTDFIEKDRFITPQFLTFNPKTGKPSFVVVHSKITRGAYARWLIQEKVKDIKNLHQFKDLGYKFDKNLSSPSELTFVCKEFGGKGLSIKLKGK